eukprot:scaffold5769_cov402-Prasinococcus_capsulatus_cf.AAC.9
MSITISPYRISICLLLKHHLNPAATLSQGVADVYRIEAHEVVQQFLLDEIKSDEEFCEPTLLELLGRLESAVNSDEVTGELIHALVNDLRKLKCPEDLFQLVGEVRDVMFPSMNPNTGGNLTPGVSVSFTTAARNQMSLQPQDFSGGDGTDAPSTLYLQPRSCFGLFVRLCLASFDSLPFERTCRLLAQCQHYRDCVRQAGLFPGHEGDSPASGPSPSTPSLYSPLILRPLNAALNQDANPSHLRTPEQVEVRLQAKASREPKSTGILTMKEEDEQLQELLSIGPHLHKVHHLKHQNFLYHKDYPSAVNSLHCYFDYSAGQKTLSLAEVAQESPIGRFQSALLELGSTHVRFGHINEALMAINETVRVAQQHTDNTCLTYALALLCHVLLLYPQTEWKASGSGKHRALDMASEASTLLHLLRICYNRGVELSLTHVAALCQLGIARFELQNVRTVSLNSAQSFGAPSPERSWQNVSSCPVKVWNALHEATALRMDYLGNKSKHGHSSKSYTRIGSLDSLRIQERAHAQICGAAALVRAQAWKHYACAPLVQGWLLSASCYADALSPDDICIHVVKLAEQELARRGVDACKRTLEVSMSRLGNIEGKWRVHAALRKTELRRALDAWRFRLVNGSGCRRWAEADTLVSQLAAAAAASGSGAIQASGDPIGDPEGEYAIAIELYAEHCAAMGQFGRALEVLQSLFAKCYLQHLILRLPSLLLSMADIFSKANAPVKALPYVLSCASLSNSLHLHLTRACAMVSLAELWLKIGSSSEEHAREALGRWQSFEACASTQSPAWC